ncbi:hypothetical protein CMI37_10010 [Candidatus Pacearchaeota archaeon]|nr:hypothetical protein [Candidatus Pacearchaeota archaeon]
MTIKSDKVKFADLDTFLKIAPIIGLFILGYLQSLFPSKVEFEKISNQIIQMDKKITEMTVLQKAITSNTSDINRMEDRMRIMEVELAKHSAQSLRVNDQRGKKGGG